MGSDKLVEINYDPAVEFQSTLPHGERLRLAYPLVSASMKRRHMFSYLEKTPGVPDSFRLAYGKPIKITEAYHEQIEGMTVINFMDFRNKSCDYIKDYILGQNKAF